MIKRFAFLLVFFAVVVSAHAQQTMGMMRHDPGSYDNGYVLFSPFNCNTTYLIDKCGKLLHTWPSQNPPGLISYLLPDGSILREASTDTVSSQDGASLIEKISWDGVVTWRYVPDTVGGAGAHHDIEPLANGNVLIITRDTYTRAQMLAMGRRDTLLNKDTVRRMFLSEKIQELHPEGATGASIVWEWRALDHIIQDSSAALPAFGVVAKHPELIDLNYPKTRSGEWLHSNAVKYNADLDQIMFSNRYNSEFWIIDHSTTTAEAASHAGGRHHKGGDLLYRWGNPASYGRGTIADQKLFAQHDAAWIPKGYPHAGDVMVFNNGVGRIGRIDETRFSSADRITLPVDSIGNYPIDSVLPFLPASQAWMYLDTLPGETIFANAVGGAQMLKNGNVLMSNSFNGQLVEVDSNKNRVWEYLSPVAPACTPLTQGTIYSACLFFKGIFYSMDDSAFKGKTLTPGSPIESGTVTYTCNTHVGVGSPAIIDNSIFVYPNPASDHVSISSASEGQTLTLYSTIGERVAEARNADKLNTSSLPNGVYTMIIKSNGRSIVKMVNVIR